MPRRTTLWASSTDAAHPSASLSFPSPPRDNNAWVWRMRMLTERTRGTTSSMETSSYKLNK
eukprot:2052450-Pyramimonas_sp.AAC.1